MDADDGDKVTLRQTRRAAWRQEHEEGLVGVGDLG
jgi:hypothetical protein